MKPIFFAALVLFLACCASKPAKQAVSSAEAFEPAKCENNEFRGFGTGKNDEDALNAARSSLATQIHSSVKVSETSRRSQQVFNGKENLSSNYESKSIMESTLHNAHDARILSVERNAGEVATVVCMSRENAAKGFTERQRLIADSLGIVSGIVVGTEHPKRKNEAWYKTQMLMIESMKIQNLLDGWEVSKAGSFDYTNKTYGETKDYYAGYCKNHKFYWNPEQEDLYSEIAFAKLSQKLKIEKSPCIGEGISLAYKNMQNKCEFAGLSKCSLQPSLSIASCKDAQYALLKADEIGSFHQKEIVALERLQAKVKDESFWNEWEVEIKQWRPECE